MAGRRSQRPGSVSALALHTVADPDVARAFDQVSQAVETLQGARSRFATTTDLIVGTNVIRHGLGRAVMGYTLTPTYLTIAFGHAINLDNPNPELELWIDVVGSDQDGARVEVW